MKTENFWAEQVPYPKNIPVCAEVPEQVDVAVVGGGFTGLNAALVLAQSGARVAVLEQNTFGWGASSRNGGMLTPGLKAPLSWIRKTYGLELARHFWSWALESIDHVERVVTENNIACDWRRSGHLALATKPAHFERYRSNLAMLDRDFGYRNGRLLPPSELASEIGSTAFHGAVVDDVSGSVHPAKYAFGLAAAVARSGALLCEDTRVLQLRPAPGGHALRTNRGPLRAREVLLATNGYTTGLNLRARAGVFPVGSYIIVTEPLPAALQAELSPRGRMMYDSANFLIYFRLTPDGRMLFGGRNNLSTTLDLHDSAQRLQERMLSVYPQLRGVPLTHSWTGKLGITFDLMPHIGRVNGVHYAYGYCGHGVSISSYLGREVGELLAGKRTSSAFLNIPHPRNPIAFFERLFLPFVAQWYRMQDALA